MRKYIDIDLESVFNHKAILNNIEEKDLVSLENRGFGVTAEYFVFKDDLKSHAVKLIENVPFALPDVGISKYDNIECNGQTIPVPKGVYNKIHFIGFSFGNLIDRVLLKFEDGDREEVCISLLGLGVAGRTEGSRRSGFKIIDEIFTNSEKAVLIGKCTTGADVGCTYWAENINRNTSVLSEIVIPDISFMHILAITLET